MQLDFEANCAAFNLSFFNGEDRKWKPSSLMLSHFPKADENQFILRFVFCDSEWIQLGWVLVEKD